MALKIAVRHSEAFTAKQAAKRAAARKPAITGRRVSDALNVIECAELPAVLTFVSQITAAVLDNIQTYCKETGCNVADLTPADLLESEPAYSSMLSGLDDAWRGKL